ncbi:MAG: CPBP family intramembrane glutamic endopeptidase [Armatimonadota bacterium]
METPTETRTRPNWPRILSFVAITYAVDWGLLGVLYAGGVQLKGLVGGAVATAYMIVPALVVLFLARRWGVSLKEYGVRVPRRWELALAPLLPIVVAMLTVLAAVAMGLGELDPTGMALADRLAEMGQQEAAEAVRTGFEKTPLNPILLTIVSAPVAGFTINGLFAFGEELGWRGLLQRELAPMGFARASALIGLVWGLWHAPLILLGHNFPQHPRLGVLVMTAACVPLGIVFSWLALRAQTIFAAAVGHGTLNAISGVTMMAVRGGDSIEIFILGYAGIVATAAVAAVLPSRSATCASCTRQRRRQRACRAAPPSARG